MISYLSDISSNKVLHNRFVLLLFLSRQRDLVLESFYSDESFDYSDDDGGDDDSVHLH